MTNPPSLDPFKTPWKRGDVVTRAFKTAGFVVCITPDYMEVRWNRGEGEENIERIPANEIDWLTRFAHADSMSPEGDRTNIRVLESLEALDLVQKSLAERIKTPMSEKESERLDRLVRRIFAENQCAWDAKHAGMLLALLASPKDVGAVFKFREWIHRFSCPIR